MEARNILYPTTLTSLINEHARLNILFKKQKFHPTRLLERYGFCKKSLWKNSTLTSLQVPFCEEKSVTSYKIHTLANFLRQFCTFP